MQVAYSLEKIQLPKPVILTIGNFDGMHLGHQALLHHLVNTAKKQQAASAVLTFSNHPSKVLNPTNPTPLLCKIEHKMAMLEQAGIDLALLLPFTKEFSEQSADVFLKTVRHSLPFQTLILGSDAHIGKNREGNRSNVTKLAETLGFAIEYFPDIEKNGQRISSSLIRACIRQGHLKEAETLLGRPFSIYGEVIKGRGTGTTLGFPTANLDVEDLCLPPLGVYAVRLFIDNKPHEGIANLGIAPTVRQNNKPILEVYLFDHINDLYGKNVEVLFCEFIREEKQFSNLEELKKQIALDVTQAKKYLECGGLTPLSRHRPDDGTGMLF
jgi:riboflavin kinase / FMN adenylyltransferase